MAKTGGARVQDVSLGKRASATGRGGRIVTAGSAYGSPQGMRRAVTDRLKTIAKPNGQWSLSELQRQFAYDRLLARLYTADSQWILKGAVALLARRVSVRHSTDIDLYRQDESEVVERELRAAAELDLGDWFRFEIGPGESLSGTTDGARYLVVTSLGATKWSEFHVDLVGTGVQMTGTPEDVPPVAQIEIPGVDQPGYRAYPLVDHIADKITAIIEVRGDGRPSTRFRDLVDLTALLLCVRVKHDEQNRALQSELTRRNIPEPQRFDVPDRKLWDAGFGGALRKAISAPVESLDEAVSLVGKFVDPLLNGSAVGIWNAGVGRWEDQSK